MKRLNLFLLLLLTPMFLLAQTTISGVVMAEGEPDPVIGANVMVKGTTNGTITDFDGNFLLEANVGDILVFSHMGYQSQEVKASSSFMRITLKADNVMLDEVVAIGYSTMKRSDLTGAILPSVQKTSIKPPLLVLTKLCKVAQPVLLLPPIQVNLAKALPSVFAVLALLSEVMTRSM